MKKKLICGIYIMILIISFHINSNAKYVLDDFYLKAASIQIDRTIPQVIFLETKNIMKHVSSNGEKYDITCIIKIKESNLMQDTINKEKIITTIDEIRINPEIIFTETNHTQDEHTYEIQINGIEKGNILKIELASGLVTDLSGWDSTLQVKEIPL